MKASEFGCWAIIPTRGASKGLPEKNVLAIAGRPLISYMVAAALSSKRVTRVIVSTDSDQIANVVSGISGAEVYRHDPTLSESGQPSFGAFQYALKMLLGQGGTPKVVALLRATTPLCLAEDIDNSVDLLILNQARATGVVSVTKSDVHPKRVYAVDPDGYLAPREATHEKHFPMPRQHLDDVYIRNGAIYATFPKIVLQNSLWGERPIPYIMPKDRSININDEIDFILAEELLKRRNQTELGFAS